MFPDKPIGQLSRRYLRQLQASLPGLEADELRGHLKKYSNVARMLECKVTQGEQDME